MNGKIPRKDKKDEPRELSHLKNVFMNTPVASANESTGSSEYIWDTMYQEKLNEKRDVPVREEQAED